MSEVDGGDGAGASMGRPKLRVALYGGSFDPPHQCHVLVATWALCRGGVDEVWLVPALGHAFGKRLTPFETRCRMAAAAVAHLGPRVRVEPIEGRLPAPSYTMGAASISGGTTIEELVRSILEPKLNEWADQNLPRLVEQIVRDKLSR